MEQLDEQKRIALAGAALDTGNLGVSALGLSVLHGIKQRMPDAQVTLFDHDRGVRKHNVRVNGSTIPVDLCGAKSTRRWYQSESLFRIRIAARLGGLRNPAAQRLLAADAILSIAGGDSFTDLYGQHRFRSVIAAKTIAMENDVSLILLPQTYGPFRSSRTRIIAQRIVRGARLAWARDTRSFETLRDLLGPHYFDPQRHRAGVDVAFGLRSTPRSDRLSPELRRWLTPDNHESDRPGVAGVNVSGLIWHDPKKAHDHFGFRACYRKAIIELISRILSDSDDVRVLLVPHVLSPEGHYESDSHACRLAAEAVKQEHSDGAKRVMIVPPDFDASETKWIISRCDWFCGTRMHSTIAALSSGIPTAAIAYSDKTAGVFETCGQAEHVADPRTLDTEAVVEQLYRSWRSRASARRSLESHLPAVLDQAERQMDEIVRFCAGAEHGSS